MSIEAILFDIDGTLYDWEACLDQALDAVRPLLTGSEQVGMDERFRKALAEYAFVERAGRIVDRRFWMLFVDPVPPWRAALGNTDTAGQVAERFRSLLRPVPYTDARPALQRLHGWLPMGVLTNGPYAEHTVAELGLSEYFRAIVFPGEDKRKPLPEAFFLACRELGPAPERTLYVGDSLSHDVEGALNAGLRAVWIDRYGENHPLPPGAVRIASLVELPAIVEKLQAV